VNPGSLEVAAELGNLAEIHRFVRESIAGWDLAPSVVYDLQLAVEEATANIILHGYRGRPGTIEIDLSRQGDELVVRLRDDAPPFDPTGLPPPDLALPVEQRPVGGIGVYLMCQAMDEVTHRLTPRGGNELTLIKKIIPEPS